MLEEFPGYHWIIEEGEARGKEIGKATAMRRNVMQLVQNRLDDVPGDLAEGLEALGVQELEALFARVLEVQDSAEVKAALEPC